MATAAISAEYAQDAADVVADLAEDGHACSFGSKDSNGFDPDGDYIETGKANVFPLDFTVDLTNDIRATDRMYMVDASVDLSDCTHMIDSDESQSDGAELTIVKADPFKPDGSLVIYYEVQARL